MEPNVIHRNLLEDLAYLVYLLQMHDDVLVLADVHIVRVLRCRNDGQQYLDKQVTSHAVLSIYTFPLSHQIQVCIKPFLFLLYIKG